MTEKCILCDVELGDHIIITQTNIGPLCKDCFDIYLWDKPEFWRRLKEKSEAEKNVL
jgi:hypothetical protein